MEDLKKEYDEVTKERGEVAESIKKLKTYKSVIKYLKLCKRANELSSKQTELYDKMLVKRYSECNHIVVMSSVEHDYMEGRSYRYYGCIKCGLDSTVANRGYGLNYEEDRMLKVMNKYKVYGAYTGINTGIACELSDGKALYQEIIEKNKDLTDKEIVEIFKERAKAKKLTLKSIY